MAKNKKYIRWHQNNYLYIAIKFYAIKSYYVCVFIATFEKGTKILDLLFNLSLKVKKYRGCMKLRGWSACCFMWLRVQAQLGMQNLVCWINSQYSFDSVFFRLLDQMNPLFKSAGSDMWIRIKNYWWQSAQ